MENNTSAGISAAGGLGLSAMSLFPPDFLSQLPPLSKIIIGWTGFVLFVLSVLALIKPAWFSHSIWGNTMSERDEKKQEPPRPTPQRTGIKIGGTGNIVSGNKVFGYDRGIDGDNSTDSVFKDNEVVDNPPPKKDQ